MTPRIPLDIAQFYGKADKLRRHFSNSIVNQESSTDKVVELYQTYTAKLNDPKRPLGSIIFLGPTGVGKTYVAEKFAEFVGSDLLKIDCGEYQYGHEIAKLVGSPPGYLGHRETKPVLSQDTLNKLGDPGVVLFDEIDKAHDSVRGLLLGVLDKAVLTIGDNSVVRFNNIFVLMTANLGAKDIYKAQGYQTGFTKKKELTAKEIENIPQSALREAFSPEFINRIDRVATFNPLGKKDYKEIAEKELYKAQERIFVATKVKLKVSKTVVEHILNQPFDDKMGARPLRQAVEKMIVQPIASIIGVVESDIYIDVQNNKLEYSTTKLKDQVVLGTAV